MQRRSDCRERLLLIGVVFVLVLRQDEPPGSAVPCAGGGWAPLRVSGRIHSGCARAQQPCARNWPPPMPHLEAAIVAGLAASFAPLGRRGWHGLERLGREVGPVTSGRTHQSPFHPLQHPPALDGSRAAGEFAHALPELLA